MLRIRVIENEHRFLDLLRVIVARNFNILIVKDIFRQ